MDTKVKQNVPISAGKQDHKGGLSSLHPIAEMERMFDRLFGRETHTSLPWQGPALMGNWPNLMEMRMPSLDIIDRDSEILVRAEVPGIDKKDLDISISDNLLTIKGQSRNEQKEEKGDYYRHEISSSSVARSVSLPGTVDSSRAAANLKDGILEITLPKLEQSKRHSISVK